MRTYKFTDDAISHIAKLLQVAILTGTDIIDNLRSVVMVANDDGMLAIDPDHSESFNNNIQAMLDDAPSLKEEAGSSKKSTGPIKIDMDFFSASSKNED